MGLLLHMDIVNCVVVMLCVPNCCGGSSQIYWLTMLNCVCDARITNSWCDISSNCTNMYQYVLLCSCLVNHLGTFSIWVNRGGKFFVSLFHEMVQLLSVWRREGCVMHKIFLFCMPKMLNPYAFNSFINRGKSWDVYFQFVTVTNHPCKGTQSRPANLYIRLCTRDCIIQLVSAVNKLILLNMYYHYTIMETDVNI